MAPPLTGAVLRVTAALFAGVVVAAGSGSAAAQPPPDGLITGGGSPNDVVVEVPRGGSMGPVHGVFCVNRTADTIELEFVADVSRGITVTPSAERVAVAPGQSTRITYGVSVARDVEPGDYAVVVALRRTDVVPAEGEIAFVPSFTARWTLRVVAAAASLRIKFGSLVPRDRSVVTVTQRRGATSTDLHGVAPPGERLSLAPGEYAVRLDVGGEPIQTRRLSLRAGAREAVVMGRSADGSNESEPDDRRFAAGVLVAGIVGFLVTGAGIATVVARRRRSPQSGS